MIDFSLSPEVFGLFLLLAGFVVGLGSVTVIDVHGLLGRASPYWSETTIRVHKVTKPLIWVGIALAIVGGALLYWHEPFVGIPLVHSIAAVVLIANGCFLSFKVSPFLLHLERSGRAREILPQSWQIKIMLSLLVSDIVWWGSLFLLALHLIS